MKTVSKSITSRKDLVFLKIETEKKEEDNGGKVIVMSPKLNKQVFPVKRINFQEQLDDRERQDWEQVAPSIYIDNVQLKNMTSPK